MIFLLKKLNISNKNICKYKNIDLFGFLPNFGEKISKTLADFYWNRYRWNNSEKMYGLIFFSGRLLIKSV